MSITTEAEEWAAERRAIERRERRRRARLERAERMGRAPPHPVWGILAGAAIVGAVSAVVAFFL